MSITLEQLSARMRQGARKRLLSSSSKGMPLSSASFFHAC